jgi:hypothetical protein
MYSAIYGSASNSAQNPKYLCPTGNCTWDRFATLAYCPKCIDVSDLLNRTCEDGSTERYSREFCNVTFPSGSPYMSFIASEIDLGGSPSTYFAVAGARSAIALDIAPNVDDSVRTLRTIFPVWHSIRAAVDAATVFDIEKYHYSIQNNTRIIGTECTMLPCILSIDAAVKDGSYQEQIVDTHYLSNITATDGIVAPPWGEEKGVKPGEGFGLTPEAYGSAVASFVSLDGTLENSDGGVAITFTSDEIQAIFSADYTKETCETPDDNFACVYKAIGSAM